MFNSNETKNTSPEAKKENQFSKKALENKLKDLQSKGLAIDDQTIAKVNFLSEKGRFFGASQVEKAMKDIDKMTRSFLKGKLDQDEKQELAQDIRDVIDERGGRTARLKESIDNTKNELVDGATKKWESVKTNVGDAYDATKGAVESGGRFVAGKATELKDQVVGKVEDLKDKVTEKYENTKEAFSDFVSGVRTGYQNEVADSEADHSNAEITGEKLGVAAKDAVEAGKTAGRTVLKGFEMVGAGTLKGFETVGELTVVGTVEGAKLLDKAGRYVFESGKQGYEAAKTFMTETVPSKAREIKDNASEKITEVKKSALEKKQSWFSKLINKLQNSNDKTSEKLQVIESRVNEKKARGNNASGQADILDRAMAA